MPSKLNCSSFASRLLLVYYSSAARLLVYSSARQLVRSSALASVSSTTTGTLGGILRNFVEFCGVAGGRTVAVPADHGMQDKGSKSSKSYVAIAGIRWFLSIFN